MSFISSEKYLAISSNIILSLFSLFSLLGTLSNFKEFLLLFTYLTLLAFFFLDLSRHIFTDFSFSLLILSFIYVFGEMGFFLPKAFAFLFEFIVFLLLNFGNSFLCWMEDLYQIRIFQYFLPISGLSFHSVTVTFKEENS